MRDVAFPVRLAVVTVVLAAFTAIAPTALAQSSAPVVTNVIAQQIAGTGLVRITYDVSDANGDSVAASVICSSNNGQTFDLLPVTLSGDVHRPMVAGPGKVIIWNAAADYPGQAWTQVVAKVVASNGPQFAGEMVYVPAGNFNMGSNYNYESPIHTVYLDSFHIDKYEVTNAQFEAFMNAGGYTTQAFWSSAGWAWRTSNNITQPGDWGNDGYHSGPSWPGFPVTGVSWYEAEAYTNFVGKRLPTEAEWEKAARGTDERTYPYAAGSGEGPNFTRMNFPGSRDPYEPYTTPVGFFDGRVFPSPQFTTLDSPGPYGAYDQAGNVMEWVKDWYENYYSSPPSNPQGPDTGTNRVLRGGSCSSSVDNTRCSSRVHQLPTFQQASLCVGFRCARTP